MKELKLMRVLEECSNSYKKKKKKKKHIKHKIILFSTALSLHKIKHETVIL